VVAPVPTPVALPNPPEPTPAAPAPDGPPTKTLQIRSTPEGARIWIDGVEHGRTNAIIELPATTPDFVTVRVSLDRYQPMEREVEVITGTAVFELREQRRIRRRATPPPRRSSRPSKTSKTSKTSKRR
jgi:hypothetical protein